MEFYEKDFGKILKANAQAQRHDLLPEGTDCFRVYDRNLVQFPVTVDLYGKYAKVVDYGEEPLEDSMRDLCINICTRMLYLDEGKVLYSYRAKRQDKEQHEKQKDESIFVEVHENNHLFKVDLSSHIDTGLFLDHSLTRRFIEEQSAGRSVLNLFSYTGSFSVYAACGGATSVTSVDMSSSYSKWAEENLRANGYEGSFYKCVTKEAGKFIFEALEKGEKYDIVIFDPPSFSNSHKMEGNFDVARDYGQWIKKICGLLNKKGFILFSTNLSTFRMDKRTLKGLSVKDITDATSAPGFVKGR